MPTKEGKSKYIATPEIMWGHFEDYRTETKGNPLKRPVFVGRDGEEKAEKLQRPLTLEGFENYLADAGIIQDIGNYFSNNKGIHDEFVQVCKRIKRVIRQDQIEGGMAGIYNPSITQRLNGLVDKKEESGAQTITVKYERKDNNVEPTAPDTAESFE
jgi:hypothetical protein